MIPKRATQYTRTDIAQILENIAEPGKKREKKLQAIKDLKITNSQNIPLEDTLTTFQEW